MSYTKSTNKHDDLYCANVEAAASLLIHLLAGLITAFNMLFPLKENSYAGRINLHAVLAGLYTIFELLWAIVLVLWELDRGSSLYLHRINVFKILGMVIAALKFLFRLGSLLESLGAGKMEFYAFINHLYAVRSYCICS